MFVALLAMLGKIVMLNLNSKGNFEFRDKIKPCKTAHGNKLSRYIYNHAHHPT